MGVGAALWPLEWWLTIRPPKYEEPTRPWRIRMMLYWLLVFMAKGLAEVPFVPESLKRVLVPQIVKTSSLAIGYQSSADLYFGCSCLGQAIAEDDPEKVMQILKEYPSAASTSWMGIMPLNNAINSNALRAAEILIDYGKQNPAAALRSCKTVESLRFLVRKGANPQATDSESFRSVDHAAINGWIEVAESMITLGALPSPTVLTMLRQRGHDDIADRLSSTLKAIRKEKRTFASLVLVRQSQKLFYNDLVRELIFEFADIAGDV